MDLLDTTFIKPQIVSSLAEPVATLWKDLQAEYTRKKGSFSVASPLSSTPLPIYEWIIKNAGTFENWDKVRFVLMDEMLGNNKPPFHYIPIDDTASYEGFTKKYFLDPLQITGKRSIELIKPNLSKLEEFSTEIDLLILALGIDGNYANIMPGTPESTGWHIAHLTSAFRQSHTKKVSQSYAGAIFREYGMSLGHQQVLMAKHVVVIISGEKKRELTKQLLSYKTFEPNFPLSIMY